METTPFVFCGIYHASTRVLNACMSAHRGSAQLHDFNVDSGQQGCQVCQRWEGDSSKHSGVRNPAGAGWPIWGRGREQAGVG